jgi:DNA-binding SARP family transcriptional activator
VVIIEAPAGYGKSVLGAELVDSWRTVGIEVDLGHGQTTGALFVARLRAAVGRAGFSEAAAADVSGESVDAIDALVGALADQRCAFVIDDAHNALPDAGGLIDRIATRIEGEQRLVVMARRLPDGAGRLRRAEYFHLTLTDLALDSDETLRLCRSGFGLQVGLEAAKALDQATGGWTAATVLAAARSARTGEPVGSVGVPATQPGGTSSAIGAILDEGLVSLGPSARQALAQVARLPLVDAQLVDIVTGEPGFFDRAVRAGLPFGPARGPWWDLPGPVRDYLSSLAPLERAAMRRAADQYRQRGELGWALQLLLASGDHDEAAAVLAATPPEIAEQLDGLELQVVFDQLPDAAVEANPDVLLVVGRSLRLATFFERGDDLIKRAARLAGRTRNDVLARAAAAEEAAGAVRDLKPQEAQDMARAVLAAAGPSEGLTRARAHHALGQALCWRVDAAGRRDEAALAEAEECFWRAADGYRALGMRSALSGMAPYWAISIEFARGQATAAMKRLDEALALVGDRPRRWAYVMCFRAMVAAELGQDEVCRTAGEEVLRMAEQLDSDLFRAHGHWKLAVLASYRDDAEGTVNHLRQAELHKQGWWGPASGDFLAEAADLVDRVGRCELAREYLGRAKAEPKDAAHLVALAEAALEARHGDPVRAEELLAVAGRQRVDPREYWRITLLRAFAAFRRGEDQTAGSLAAQSFDEAARLGQPALPAIRERSLTDQLLGLAVATGKPAALELRSAALPVSLVVLGRFELTVAGRTVALGGGQEGRLLRMVAVNGGHMHAEQAIEALWPEVSPDAGRNRLRTVLNRLRSSAGNVLGREGNLLALDRAVRVDFDELLREAARAQALARTDLAQAATVARAAIVRYPGELLPDDPYEDWAEEPRDRARRAMLELFDLCEAEAAHRGDLDALRRMVERGIELAPHDDSRYLRVASALLQQGRRGEALSVVDRARSAFAEVGLEPPRPLVDLERSI